jgi:hypothetical protein
MRSFIVRTLTVTSVRPSALATARSVSVPSQESSSSVQWRMVPGIPCVSQFRWTTVEFFPNVRPMARSLSVPISDLQFRPLNAETCEPQNNRLNGSESIMAMPTKY